MNPETEQQPGSKAVPLTSGLLDTLEKLAKISGFAAVFGYLSLRSHLNYLGIPSQAMLGVDRYLAEAFQFLTALFYVPELFLVALSAALFISLTRAGRGTRSIEFSKWRIFKDRYNLTTRLRGVAPPLVLISAVCGVTLSSLHCLTSSGFSVAVGALQFTKTGEFAATAFRPAGEDQFLLVALCFVLGLAFYHWRPTEVEMLPAALWKAVGIALILLALQLPILYGMFVRPTTYSEVEVRQKDQSGICGVLVLDTGERIALWRAKSGHGWVEVLPAKELQMRVVGDIDLLWAAGKSFGNGEDSPSCIDTAAKSPH